MKKTIIAAVAVGLSSWTAIAGTSLSNDSVVRIQAGAIEGGWHTGRLHLDQQNCWMVRLDKATQDNYTMLALTVVDQLQLAGGTGWTPVGLKAVLRGQPAVCREYDAD